ncbi:MAG: LCP family protein [Bacillota bacterium]|nr:LCP family protein [Bacillota bacterium]
MSDKRYEPSSRIKESATSNSPGSNTPKRNGKYNRKKKLKRRRRIVFGLLLIFLFAIGFTGAYFYNIYNKTLGKINVRDINKDNSSLGISQDVIDNLKEKDADTSITNIALFGIDSRDMNQTAGSRSDSIMVATIDYKHKKLKLTSILRDTRVKIDGHGTTKINAAYAYGGPQLAIKTLNQNFDLNIRDYVTINFYGLEDIIDGLGGITLDVKKNEVSEINKYIKELCDIDHKKYVPLTKSGVQKLSGRQATSYARIRHVGNGDWERTDRQRTVMDEMFKEVMGAGVTQYISLMSSMLPYVETSIPKSTMLSMGTKFFTSGIKNIDQARFPADGYWTDPTIDGVSYIQAKMPDTKNQIDAYIFDDVPPPGKAATENTTTTGTSPSASTTTGTKTSSKTTTK